MFEYTFNNIEENGRLLVHFLYNTSDEMRLLRMYPEVLVTNTMHEINREETELFTIASKDDTNSAFNAYRAFILNSQQWVF